MSVLMETTLGNITVDLYCDERPRCCLNFLKLCKIKYYNYVLFHSIQENLVAQTGDPTDSGTGGESIFGKLYGEQARYFEMETSPRIKHLRKGLVSMVNNGDNLHGSQFFFTLADDLDYLDNKHTVFGEVAEGMEVLKVMNGAYCDKLHRPYKDIRVTHTIILADPYDDPDGLDIPDRSPVPTKERLESGRIGAYEEIDDTKGLTVGEVKERMDQQEANANTQILEMLGDLPSADVRPPDNVLFVCKLNPVTTAEDLEIIFSRFGEITSCEVIKDQKSGESLQYAFVEFKKDSDCEAAYFKMDNVLIDDRRIHVDFSQSVSKLNWNDKWKNFKTGKNPDTQPQKYAFKDFSRRDNKYDLVLPHDDLTHEPPHGDSRQKQRARSRSRERTSGSAARKKSKKSTRDSDGDKGTRTEPYKSHKSHKRDSSKKHKHRHRDSS